MKTINILFVILFFIILQTTFSQNISNLDTITAETASTRIGEEVIIKAKVVTTFYAKNSTGKPTFLNLEKPFPDNPVAIIIFEEQLEALGINAKLYEDKTVIVKGTIKQYKDEAKPYKYKPSITIYGKDQLIILNEK